jgi:glycosyltransferase involved in cell wall biosynthesis
MDLNILYVTSADFDATTAPTVRARGLARALARRGCKVTLAGANGDPGREAGGPYAYVRIPYPHCPRTGALLYQTVLAGHLARTALSHDLLLLRETPWSAAPYLAGLPVFLEVNGLAIEEARLRGVTGPASRIARFLYRWGYRRARRIFALTPRIRDHLVTNQGTDPDRVTVVSNAVELDRFHPVDRAEARRDLGLPDGLWVFYVGSYHAQHGLHHLLEAARLLKDRGSGIRFLMAGAGDEDFARQVQERGQAGQFRFLGRVDDATLTRAIGTANLCLNPAAPETRTLTDATFPQKLLEYMACGRAVLSVGDSPEMIRTLDGAGRVLPPTEPLPSRMAGTLESLLRDPAGLDRMGARGLDRVRAEFGYDRVVDLYLNAFREAR